MSNQVTFELSKEIGVPDVNGTIIPAEVMQRAIRSPAIHAGIKNRTLCLYNRAAVNFDDLNFALSTGGSIIEDPLAYVDNLEVIEEGDKQILKASLVATDVHKIPTIPVDQIISVANGSFCIRGFVEIEDNVVKDLYISALDVNIQKIITFDIPTHKI